MGDLGDLVVHFDQRIIRDPQICGGDRSSKERGSRYVPCLQALRPEKHPRRSWLIFDAGSDRSRGYCLEMICADFLAGVNLDNGDPEMLLFSMTRFFKFLPEEQRQAFLGGLSEKAS